MDDEIFSARSVLGLKPLSLPEGRLLLILREDAEAHTGIAVLQERGKQWSELKLLPGGALRVRAMDVQIVKGDVWVAAELNNCWQVIESVHATGQSPVPLGSDGGLPAHAGGG